MIRKSLAALLTFTASGTVALAVVPGASAAGTTFTPPSSISSNCSAGATVALNTWIAGLPNGTSAAPVTLNMGDASKCYLINDIAVENQTIAVDGVRVLDKKFWNITGKARMEARTENPGQPDGSVRNRAQMVIKNGDHVTVDGLAFKGTRTLDVFGKEADRNVLVQGGTWIRLLNITADTAGGDNVQIQAYTEGGVAKYTKVFSLYNSKLVNAGRHNASLTGADGAWLTQNVLDGNHYWGVNAEIHATTFPMKNINLTKNTLKNGDYGLLSLRSQTGNTAGGADLVTVKDNTMELARRATNNEFVTLNGGVTNAVPTKNVSITGNTFDVRQYGITANWVNGITVSGNKGTTQASGSASDGAGKYGLLAMGPGNTGVVKVTSNSFLSKHTARHTSAWLKKTGATPVSVTPSASGNTTN